MKFSNVAALLVCIGLASGFIKTEALAAETVLSPFEGSTLIGEYSSRFAPLTILTEPMDSQKVPGSLVLEGAVTSNIYTRPTDTSPFEIIKSYAQALASEGFEVLLSCEKSRNNCKTSYIISTNYNELFKARQYDNLPRDTITWLAFNAHHYLSAKKKTPDGDVYAMVIASDKNDLYSVDTLTIESMQQDTVQISTKVMTDSIASEGRVVLSGIFFETGSAVITDKSTTALTTIAEYLNANADQSFYVVGHTDDTGNLETNVSLSGKRAQSVVNALKDMSVAGTALSAQGVGPFSPSSTNASDNGRAKNRRVELVLRVQ